MPTKKKTDKPAVTPAKKTVATKVPMEKVKKIKLAMDKIDADYGKGTIMLLSEKPSFDSESVSTSCLSIDTALGVGGLPKGRIIEIYGPESSGKTTLCMHVIAEIQKQGGVAAMVDAEHAFDFEYAKKLGIDVEELLISQPDYGEQALEVVDRMVDAGVDLVIVDSVAALVPKAELEGEMGQSKMGLHARLMSQSLRMLTGKVAKSNTILIFINQLREKIGVMFGNPETTTGGNALKFYASIRIDIRKTGVIKDGDEFIGNKVKVKVVKNKVAPPFRSAEFDIRFGEGIDKFGDILDLAAGFEIIKKAGSWFSYNGDKLGQGRDAVRDLLHDNPELFEEINQKTREFLISKQ